MAAMLKSLKSMANHYKKRAHRAEKALREATATKAPDTSLAETSTHNTQQQTDPSQKISTKKSFSEFKKDWNATHPERVGKRGAPVERKAAWKKYKKDYKPSKREILKKIGARRADTQYYFALTLLKKLDATQPTWSPADTAEMCRIFEISDKNTCIITKKSKGVGRGDHVYDVCKNLWSDGILGSDHLCNRLPVTGALNAGYKIFPGKHPETGKARKFQCSGVSKNIGIEELTDEEIKELLPENLDLYRKFQQRKEYLKRRGFKDHYVLDKKIIGSIEYALNCMYDPEAVHFKLFLEDLNGM